MRTFKQFIAEETDDAQDIEDFLSANCQPLLNELNATPLKLLTDLQLYRGLSVTGSNKVTLKINGIKQACFIKSVRKDRRALDTPSEISRVLDDAFEEHFKWRPRSQGLFAFGRRGREEANEYGKLCNVFPMGKFRYLWSPAVPDLYNMTKGKLVKNEIPYKKEKLSQDELGDIYEIMEKIVFQYKSTDLRAAITGPVREIMFDCDSYLAVPVKPSSTV